MAGGVMKMGRPKRGIPKPPVAADLRVAIIHLKGTPEYAAWLDDFNRATRIPKATLFRMGMEMMAKARDFTAPPEM